ncbi:hypothetical protein V9T40_001651 [Parthenolecanium corni]|uniref:U3 small nucleolar RNA-associated protein 13 C-terminal domain-containing protein n=1 Tax=Parthenolecanium corni TaxID=536013 RepID=A0AAN9TYH8_9HEMI
MIEYNYCDENDVLDDPVLTFALSSDDELLASGHKNGLIYLWRIIEVVEGTAQRIVNEIGIQRNCILEFHKINDDEIIFASGDEQVVRGWHLQSDSEHQLFNQLAGQYNRISNILIPQYLISVGFNPLAVVWDLKTKAEVRSIPISLNGLTYLYSTSRFYEFLLYTLGKLVVYDFLKGAQVFIHDGDSDLDLNEGTHNIESNKSEQKLHSIVHYINTVYKVDSNFTCLKQMTGYLNEILASTFFGEEDEYLVVASNSSHLNVYDRNMNCSLLKGHSDCIICVATFPGFPNILVFGSKDHSVGVWMCKDGFFKCVASVTRHQASVGAVVLSHNSQDGKIINASKDQTLKTIEGHDYSVLNCAFFNNGTQIVSCGNDGLVKVWTIKNNECVFILDKHASKDWAIAVSSDGNKFLTGGTDSRLVFWRVTTKESRLEEIKTTQERVEREQHLSIYWSSGVGAAFGSSPFIDFNALKFYFTSASSGKQTKDLETVIGQLNVDQKETIVKYASEWNKNSRSSYIAQLVLSFLMPEIITNDIKLSNETLEGLSIYKSTFQLTDNFNFVPYNQYVTSNLGSGLSVDESNLVDRLNARPHSAYMDGTSQYGSVYDYTVSSVYPSNYMSLSTP